MPPTPSPDALEAALVAAGLDFTPLPEERRDAFRQLTLDAWERFAFADAFQALGRARIERAVPLCYGFERPTRLIDRAQAAVLWADPEHPDRVFLSLGVGFPPPLWPSAAVTPEALRAAFGPYLLSPFTSAHRASKRVRLLRETFADAGLEGLDHLLQILQVAEPWLDAHAVWRSEALDDPWPEDTTNVPMLQLHVLARRAAEEHPLARPVIAMRSLWSRSIVVFEAGSCGSLILELRYEPAPQDDLAFAREGLPTDLPADVAASLLRGSSMTSSMLRANLASAPHPNLLIGLVELENGEPTTFAELAARARGGGEMANVAVSLAAQEGARGLLYELACETTDPELGARLAELTRIGPPQPAPQDEDEAGR